MNRDLDAEIAEKIFGWKLVNVSTDANGENACKILYPPDTAPTQEFYNTLPRVGTVHRGFYAPYYSRDLKEALALCQHVKLGLPLTEIPIDSEKLAAMALEHFLRGDIAKEKGNVTIEHHSTLDWEAAIKHIHEVAKNIEHTDENLGHRLTIGALFARYEFGERTPELYRQIMAL